MAFSAENAGAVSVVEQSEFADKLVLVGINVFAEDAEARIAIGFFDIAQDLVVCAVFFNYVNDVFNEAGFADAFGNRYRFLIGPRFLERLFDRFAMIIGVNLLSQFREFRVKGNLGSRKRTAVLV